ELAAQKDLVHHRRNPVGVGARAEKHRRAARAGVAGGEHAHVAEQLRLGQARGQRDGRARAQIRRHARAQGGDRAGADRPPTGAKRSETVVWASTTPTPCPGASVAPTAGTSTKTTSPSAPCAKSVMPTTPSLPSRRSHSCSFV